MDTIKRMGDAYMPLVDAISKMAEAELANPMKASMMTMSILMFVETFKSMFMTLEGIKIKNASDVIDEIIRFNEVLADLKSNGLDKFNIASAQFIDRFSSDDKWRKIKSNVTYLKKEFQEMSKAINTIDIKKAKAFENNIKLLVDRNNGKNLGEILELLKEMFHIMSAQVELQEKQAALPPANSGFGNAFGNQGAVGTPILGAQPQTPTGPNGKKLSQDEIQLLNLLNTNFSGFQQLLTQINQKLGQPLKVRVEESNSLR